MAIIDRSPYSESLENISIVADEQKSTVLDLQESIEQMGEFQRQGREFRRIHVGSETTC